jgi:hypothetical protein
MMDALVESVSSGGGLLLETLAFSFPAGLAAFGFGRAEKLRWRWVCAALVFVAWFLVFGGALAKHKNVGFDIFQYAVGTIIGAILGRTGLLAARLRRTDLPKTLRPAGKVQI